MKALIFAGLLLPLSGLALASETILLANFNNKPLNQPIGTGGAAVGEPDDISPLIEAIVRAAPGGGRELELVKEPSFGTAAVRFQFLDLEEVTEGQLLVRMTLRLGSVEDFSSASLLLRERFNAAQSFLNFDLFNDGDSQVRRPGFPALRFNNTVNLSALNRIEVLYDLDERLFSVCLNGSVLATDLEPGIQTERGIGSLRLSLPAAGDTLVWIDQVEVQKGTFGGGGGGNGDRVFADRFEPQAASCPF